MIKFNLAPAKLWVNGDAKAFDDTELARFPREQRKEVSFLIRTITGEEDQEIRKSCARKRVGIDFRDYKGLSDMEKIWFLKSINEMDPPVDMFKYVQRRLNLAVLDWAGIGDENGKLLKCTEENKKAYFGTVCPRVGNVLNQLIVDLTMDREGLQKALDEEQEKNLEDMPDGKPPGAKK